MITKNRIQGFTLVELMVALFILSIGLLAMAKMQMSAIQGNTFGGRGTTAVALGQDQMESLINQSLDPWPTVAMTGVETDPTLLGQQYTGHTVNWSITPDDLIPDTATLSVVVEWPGGKSPITLVSIKRR